MWIKIANVLLFGLMIVMNYLANSLPINDKTTGQLSAQYPNLFVPAGITFSIWGIIYLMLFGFIFWQFRESGRPVASAMGWAFAISSLFNAIWIITWHYELPGLSILVMLVIMVSLLYINLALKDQQSMFAKASFGVYLGWISVAMIANITAYLVSINWGGWGISDQAWAIVMIVTGMAVAVFTLINLQNPFIGAAVIWAFAGIALNRWGSHPAIVAAALIAVAIVAVFTIKEFIKMNHPASS